MPDIDLSFQPDSYPLEAFSYQHHMTQWGVTKARAKHLVRKFKEERVVRSETHQVAINAFSAPLPFGSGTWLSIKQVDKGVIANRHDLAAIMRVLLPGHGGFELFPAPDRLVDTSNQYHVWALPLPQINGLVMAPLSPAEQHSGGFELQRLAVTDDDRQHLVAMPVGASGDWRDIYELKESRYPGCEGFLYFHETPSHPLHDLLVCLDEPRFRLPFGFNGRAVADSARAERVGAKQRELSSYGRAQAVGGLPGVE